MGDTKLNCGQQVAKWFLVAVNVIFLLLGVALFILGMIVRFNPNAIVDGYLQPLFEQANTNANQNQFGNQVQDQFNNLDLSAILSGIGIAVIVVGVIILAIGFLGLFGALCNSRCMLIAYAVVVILLLLIQFSLLIVYFAQKAAIDNAIKTLLQDTINTKYRGENSADAYSAALNYLFAEGDCCGVDSYTDMHTATQWQRTYVVQGQTYRLEHPFTCCKDIGNFPNYQTPSDPTCAVTPNNANSNFQTGCFQVIDTYIKNNISAAVIVVFVIFGIIQIAAAVFAIMLIVAIGRSDW
ncbi:tetraspanin-9-like [Liolophura sinensis]|uniref:tetraspanin-9-like n=1 Tax=Liolophura sinensis TaxID=3198878 RepID=UPI0031585865